jgi:hypothetical protein
MVNMSSFVSTLSVLRDVARRKKLSQRQAGRASARNRNYRRHPPRALASEAPDRDAAKGKIWRH